MALKAWTLLPMKLPTIVWPVHVKRSNGNGRSFSCCTLERNEIVVDVWRCLERNKKAWWWFETPSSWKKPLGPKHILLQTTSWEVTQNQHCCLEFWEEYIPSENFGLPPVTCQDAKWRLTGWDSEKYKCKKTPGGLLSILGGGVEPLRHRWMLFPCC